MSFNDKVYRLVRTIPFGHVMSYGQVAFLLDNRRASRAVGYAMFRCQHDDVPCHRVVRKDGSLAPGWTVGPEGGQRKLLEAESVSFVDDRVDMRKHRFWPKNTFSESKAKKKPKTKKTAP